MTKDALHPAENSSTCWGVWLTSQSLGDWVRWFKSSHVDQVWGYRIAAIAEDCKSSIERFRRFESYCPHQIFVKWDCWGWSPSLHLGYQVGSNPTFYTIIPKWRNAAAIVLGTIVFWRVGSNPTFGTNLQIIKSLRSEIKVSKKHRLSICFFFCYLLFQGLLCRWLNYRWRLRYYWINLCWLVYRRILSLIVLSC